MCKAKLVFNFIELHLESNLAGLSNLNVDLTY